MNDFPWLTLLILVPLAGAVATAFLPSTDAARKTGLGVSVLTLVLSLVVAAGFTLDGSMQFTEQHAWIAPLGVHYALGLDGLGLVMVLLTALLVPLVLLYSWHDAEDNARGFVGWTLALEALSLAVFTATDVFLFYVVFEATLIPAYFLISGFGAAGRQRAAIKFLIYQLAGGLVMLASVIGLYVITADAGRPTYLLSDLQRVAMDPTAEKWLFIGFFIAFAIKAPMFPVHTWLPDTTEKATPGTSVLLVCILDKIGTFGMLRLCLGLFPDASQWATPLVVVLALISIIYGAFVAIGSDHILRLVGMTSVSHFGVIVLGIFVMNSQGHAGSMLYMFNHGIATAALFLLAGYVIMRSGTTSISNMGGLEKSVPVLAGLFLLTGLAGAGLPGLSPFVSEFLVMVGAFSYAWWVPAIAVTVIIWAAVYMLWMYQRTFTGNRRDFSGAVDLNRRELAAVAPLIAGLLFFGFYPAPLLDVINPTVEQTLTLVGVSDEPPVVPAEAHEHEGGQE